MLFRTDMADERRDIYKSANELEDEVEGIQYEVDVVKDEVKITRVKVLDERGKKALNKDIGNYITIDCKKVTNLDEKTEKNITQIISIELKKLIKNLCNPEDEVLVVGLGNENLVVDSLGSKVIDNIEVTRHIKKYYPEYLRENERSVSAISPGVMGLTGLETIEVIKGIVEKTHPKLVIAIDSLASKSIDRISKSIQITDTGIVPGGGVQNSQKVLNKESLNVPVIAVRNSNCY